MSKLKHTPGPWKADGRGLYKIETQYFDKSINSRRNIADVFDEHNARLIAAAPEMLETLILAYKEVKQYTQLAKLYGEPEYLQQIIEKATGLPIDEVVNENN